MQNNVQCRFKSKLYYYKKNRYDIFVRLKQVRLSKKLD